MEKPLIVYSNVPAFKKWPTNFKLLFQALYDEMQDLVKIEIYVRIMDSVAIRSITCY